MNESMSHRAANAIVACSQDVATAWTRPCVLFKPHIYPDGNQWCALYGEDLQMGVAGFGDSPELACEDFDRAWRLAKGLESP